jgi:hypothetical protein
MNTTEWLTFMGLLGSALAWVALQLRGYIRSKDEKLESMVTHVEEIRRALLGDTFGHDGLVKEVVALKQSNARLEQWARDIEHRLEVLEAKA